MFCRPCDKQVGGRGLPIQGLAYGRHPYDRLCPLYEGGQWQYDPFVGNFDLDLALVARVWLQLLYEDMAQLGR